MTTRIPFQRIPMEFAELIGTPDEGTRIFRREGNHDEMRVWFDALCEHMGPTVSPGGAANYAGVTRAGVYRRMKSAGLTAFCFHVIGEKQTLFGGKKKLKELPVIYIPVSECQAWRRDLEERAKRIKETKLRTDEDLAAFEEADPGEEEPDERFLNYDPRDKREKGVKYLDMPWDKPIEVPREKKNERGR